IAPGAAAVWRLTPALAALRCPGCGGSLVLDPLAAERERLPSEGCFRCGGGGRGEPGGGGGARVPPRSPRGAASVAGPWERYDVQDPSEDREVFRAKTDFAASDLRGRLVLDAGCGSGRYAAVAAGFGAQVAAVDVTVAVERAREVCAHLPGVQVIQADLLRLP